MRVNQSGNNPVQNAEVSGTKKSGRAAEADLAKKAPSSAASQASGDTNTEISAKGKEFAKAKAVASGAPDVHEEKIAELKKRIAAGKYNVDADAIADKMVDEHLKVDGA